MGISEFRSIKKRLIEIYELLNEEETEQLMEEHNQLLNQLLKSDLSKIPFEEWQGMSLYSEEELDFSMTHANIDFSLLENIDYESINLKGCNVKGVRFLPYYHEENFDSDFVENHPNYFPNTNLPQEIKDKYYNGKIEFIDLNNYPSLIECIDKKAFEGKRTLSFKLINSIGIKNALKLFVENKEFVINITTKNELKENISFDNLKCDESLSYEQVKTIIYDRIIGQIRENKLIEFPPLEILPKDFIESYSNIFITEPLQKNIIDDYYAGNLALSAIRYYEKIFKDKDITLGTRRNETVQKLNILFGDVWSYIDKVPQELDDAIELFLSHREVENKIDDSQLQQLFASSVSDFVNYSFHDSTLNELCVYSNYVPLTSLFDDEKIIAFIQKCGFENLNDYNNENNLILESGSSYLEKTLLGIMANISYDDKEIISSKEDFLNYMNKMIIEVRKSNDFHTIELLKNNNEQLSKMFPQNFFSQDEINNIIVQFKVDEKEYLKTQIISALNGDVDKLYLILEDYPFLINYFKNKIIIINNNNMIGKRSEKLLNNLGQNSFLDLCAKYGSSFKYILNDPSQETDQLLENIMSSGDYETILNSYIYHKCLYTRSFDIRILPESFKKMYPELYLPSDAPSELSEIFYSKEGLNIKDISQHPDWVEYLLQVDLGNCLRPKIITTYKNFEEYTKKTENLYFVLASKMSKSQMLQMLIQYGAYLYDSNIKIDTNLNGEDFKNGILNNIYTNIIKRNIMNYKDLPLEFKNKYPNLFLDEKAPDDLKEMFYNRQIDSYYILTHPQYKDFLFKVDLEVIYEYMIITTKDNSIIKSGNLVSILQNKYGKDTTFEIMMLYGKYLNQAYNAKYLEMVFEEDYTIDNVLDKFDECIYKAILNGHLKYDEHIAKHFKDNYPSMFLKENVPDEIKNKFYNRQFSLEEFAQNPQVMNYFENTNIAWGLKPDFSWLAELFKNEDLKTSNYKRLKLLGQYHKLNDKKMQEFFKTFIIENNENIDIAKIDSISEILYRLSSSNSREIYTFRSELASQLLKIDNPAEGLDKIEKIFIKNNIPTVGKLYSVFTILHPSFEGFNLSEESMVSPVLKQSSIRNKNIIIFSDLIKASFGSNNRGINSYLKNLEQGFNLYESIISGETNYSSLDDESKKTINLFSKYLITLYGNTLKGKTSDINFKDDVISNITKLKHLFSLNGDLNYNLSDRAIYMFCHFAGIDTIKQAKAYSSSCVKNADERNRKSALSPMQLVEGDFIKGIGDIKYLSKILQNGSVSREFLGESAGSDFTPLDTDLSRIMLKESSIEEKIENTSAKQYGPIWFVLKNNDRFNITRDHLKNNYSLDSNLSKLELFYTGALGPDHYGIRTGFASSDIDYIVVKEPYDERIGLEIAINGFYIPVASTSGEILFTPKDYDDLRAKMSGLSYLGSDEYNFSTSLINEDTKDLVSKMAANEYEITRKKEKINKIIESSLFELGLGLKTFIDTDLSPGTVELIDTGSTGRGTNQIGDGDFDFIMRLDKSIMSNPTKLENFKTILLKKMGKLDSYEFSSSGDFRLKSVSLDDIEVDIDITFVEKTDSISYSTDMALKDQLTTIKKQDAAKYSYVVANILLAKKVLKQAEVYKPDIGEIPQGGLGGVGIENWILQNGGSFEDAAKSFLTAANGRTFEQFKEVYKVWNFGENHMAERKDIYPHNEFVSSNMSAEGYEKMKNALLTYFNTKQYFEVDCKTI